MQYGTIVADYRQQYLAELSPFFLKTVEQFL
jgi:hypothetical protein